MEATIKFENQSTNSAAREDQITMNGTNDKNRKNPNI